MPCNCYQILLRPNDAAAPKPPMSPLQLYGDDSQSIHMMACLRISRAIAQESPEDVVVSHPQQLTTY